MSLSKVVEYCRSQLSEQALKYLVDTRHLTTEVIDQWQLGFCPFDITGLAECTDRETLLQHKIIFEPKDGDRFSFMQNSVVFPFIDPYGRIVGVSSRPLQSSEVIKQKRLRKYWNSSFEKSSFLYGLHQATSSIRKLNKVIIGEGQIDVLMAHQHGFTNTVGTCGTALSTRHIMMLGRYTSEIVVVFDGDAAGQRALSKLKSKEQPGVVLKSVVMPAGEDIDSFLLSCGVDRFNELLETATEV